MLMRCTKSDAEIWMICDGSWWTPANPPQTFKSFRVKRPEWMVFPTFWIHLLFYGVTSFPAQTRSPVSDFFYFFLLTVLNWFENVRPGPGRSHSGSMSVASAARLNLRKCFWPSKTGKKPEAVDWKNRRSIAVPFLPRDFSLVIPR